VLPFSGRTETAPQRLRCVNRWFRFRAAESNSPHRYPLLYPIFGAFVKGLAGISPGNHPYYTPFRGICQGVGRDFPWKPPLLYPISGAFVKGLAGISPGNHPYYTPFRGICQGVGRDFPWKPPLLYPISGAFVKGLRANLGFFGGAGFVCTLLANWSHPLPVGVSGTSGKI
jgi:phage shock protein PspC (stress-responsive transcriptional regulator)